MRLSALLALVACAPDRAVLDAAEVPESDGLLKNDPLLSSRTVLTRPYPSGLFGRSLSAGDVNGDGFDDVVVGAPNAFNRELVPVVHGELDVFYGSPSGVVPDAEWTARGERNWSYLGVASTASGDVNADGFADLLVGAPSLGTIGAGTAYFYPGGASGLPDQPVWEARRAIQQATTSLGGSVAYAGDVNGDGYDDVLIGAPGAQVSQRVSAGRVFLYLGSATGLPDASSPDWDAGRSNPAQNAFLGQAVSGAGDVNGDGYDDVIVSAPGRLSRRGQVLVYHGSASGLSETAAWSKLGPAKRAGFGNAVAGAGDVNGDGYDDVVIGSPWQLIERDGLLWQVGAVHLFLGSATGLASEPALVRFGRGVGQSFGDSVAGVGDINDDGFDDVLVGVTYAGDETEGQAMLFLGSPNGLKADPADVVTGPEPDSEFGARVGSAGDVDGDGFRDLLVGAAFADGATIDSGTVTVFSGPCLGADDGICDDVIRDTGN